MSLLLQIFLLLVFLTIIYVFYYHYYYPYVVLRRRIGLPGPCPGFWHGNAYYLIKNGTDAQLKQWTKQYGSPFLYFVGISPVIHATSLELVKQVLIVKAGVFINRPCMPALLDRTGDCPNPFIAEDDDWRRLHKILLPAFTTKMVALMAASTETCSKRMLERFSAAVEENPNRSVEMQEIFSLYTTEATLSNSFGRDLDCSQGVGKQLSEALQKAFAMDDTSNSIHVIRVCLSHSRRLFTTLLHMIARRTVNAKHYDSLRDVTEQLVSERLENETASRKDLLQALVNACDKYPKAYRDDVRKLTLSEVVGVAINMVVAGTFTSTYTLTSVAYVLARNPDIQDRLIAEIKKYFSTNPDSSYVEAAASIEYAGHVVQEASRLRPIAGYLERVCSKDCIIEGITIPKGTIFTCSIPNIQLSPEYWTDPERFDPDRHRNRKDIELGSFLAFGAGPRMCMGKKTGISDVTIGLLVLLRQYRFELPDKDTTLEPDESVFASYIYKNGLHLKLTRHNLCA